MLETKFKQTEIGLIPEDWEVFTISDCLKIKHGKSQKNVESQNGKYPIYGTGGIIGYSKEFLCNKTSVLIGRKGTIDKPLYLDKPFWAVDTIFYSEVSSLHYAKYIYYLFSLIKWYNYNEASGVPSLNAKTIENIQIPLPPLPEQAAIAEALSDSDAWIESLEKLIAKKRLIKQGAMQELLTPKEDWEVKKLGEVGKTYGGLSGKSKKDFENGKTNYIPFLNVIRNVVIDKKFFDTVNISKGDAQNKVLKEDLLFNGSSETPEELGISSVLLEDIDDLYLNSFCFGYRIFEKSNLNPLFLCYLFRSSYGRKIIYYLAQGATRYNLSKSNFMQLEILLPDSLSEQTRIATILSDMDAEIESLEQKLSKARQIKQGMMQDLLTGRVRLI